MEIIRPNIFSQYRHVIVGMSTTTPGSHYDRNMSYHVGDDPVRVRMNREKFYAALGVQEDQVAFPLQQHTDTVMVCSAPRQFPSCDGLMTDSVNVFLAVTIADCTPVILFDFHQQAIGALHAGWRGTSKGIAQKGLITMTERFRTDPKHLRAFIGPSAGICCYEVGPEVARQFPESCIHAGDYGKWHVDVKKANMLQLLEYGVEESHIEVHPDCTIHNPKYHSYRRDKEKSGRMLAIIGMTQ